MSNKSARKVSLAPKAQPPRPLPELQSEAQKVLIELGNTNYQKFLFEKRAEELNEMLMQLNQEGAARKEIDDKEAKEQETKIEEKKEEAND